MTTDDGHPGQFDTHFLEKCSGGGDWDFRWYPVDGGSARFSFHDHDLEVDKTYDFQWSDGQPGRTTLALRT